MYIYSPYMVPYTLLQGNFNFPRSTNKIQFFDEFPHLKKNCWGGRVGGWWWSAEWWRGGGWCD